LHSGVYTLKLSYKRYFMVYAEIVVLNGEKVTVVGEKQDI